MKASPRQQRLLLDLQELDNTSARLRRKRDQIPERAQHAALEADYLEAKQQFMAAQRELDGQQAELGRVESDVKLVNDRRDRDNERLATNVSSKEALALQSELETLARRKSELEDREFAVLEQLEETQAAFDAARGQLETLSETRARLAQAIAQTENEIDADLRRNAVERDGLAAELQRDVLELYEETRARGGLGAARLRGNVSEGSNMELAPGDLAEIRSAAPDTIMFCPDSGAILVRAEVN